jgi:uncharacterized repeat protein (TIGR03843 family)
MDINPDDRRDPAEVEAVLDALSRGEAELEGLFQLGSNSTFLCRMKAHSGIVRAVYKPAQGERPLWDFPRGTLCRRETAAYRISCFLGWHFVPPTVYREDGPLGAGSYQEYLPLRLDENYFALRERESTILRRVAAFDVVINNADRKAMHVVRDAAGRIWLIDHGVCFHADWKVRTVIWDFAGQELPPEIRDTLRTARENAGQLRKMLMDLLDHRELEALEQRMDGLLAADRFPEPGPGVSIPWPILV